MGVLTVLNLTTEPLPSLLAVLGLLLTWELHDLEVRAGRIQSRDILRPFRQWIQHARGVRIYIDATPNDALACSACQLANGHVLAPRIGASTAHRRDYVCTNPGGCRCVLIGLAAAWPEGEQLRRKVRGALESVRLSEAEITELLRSARSHHSLPVIDRLALSMLEALHLEAIYPPLSIAYYRFLIDIEMEGQSHPYLIDAYLRLSELLEHGGNVSGALRVVENFYARVKAQTGIYNPTPTQARIMSTRKSRLRRLLHLTLSNHN